MRSEVVNEYSDKLIDIVSKEYWLGTKFKDSTVIEKILVTMSERYEACITILKIQKMCPRSH